VIFRWDQGVYGVQETLQNSLRAEQPNTVVRNWEISNLLTSELKVYGATEGTPAVENVFYDFKFLEDSWVAEDFYTPSSLLINEISTLKSRIDYATGALKDVVLVDYEEDQTIYTAQNITGIVRTHSLTAEYITVKTVIDDRTPEELFGNLVLSSQYSRVRGNVIFNEPVQIRELTTVVLNGIPTSDFAVKTQENVFECVIALNGSMRVEGNVVAAKVNGGNLADEIVFPDKISGNLEIRVWSFLLVSVTLILISILFVVNYKFYYLLQV
jgi:hypothetical protein